MAHIFYLLLLFGQHPLVRVLAHDHMDQVDLTDQDLQDHSSFPSLNLRALISVNPYTVRPSHFRRISLHQETVKAGKEEEKTEKWVEVDVTKEYGVEVTKEYGVEATKENQIELVAIQVGEGSDENIIEMDVAMMESKGGEGTIDSLRMEVFNEVVLEEILQVYIIMIKENHIHKAPILNQNPALSLKSPQKGQVHSILQGLHICNQFLMVQMWVQFNSVRVQG